MDTIRISTCLSANMWNENELNNGGSKKCFEQSSQWLIGGSITASTKREYGEHRVFRIFQPKIPKHIAENLILFAALYRRINTDK